MGRCMFVPSSPGLALLKLLAEGLPSWSLVSEKPWDRFSMLEADGSTIPQFFSS